MSTLRLFAAALFVASTSIACVAPTEEPETASTTGEAIMTSAGLRDYGFTALYFSSDTLKAPLVDRDVAPTEFTIEGYDDFGNKAQSEVRLSTIDKLGNAIYARKSGLMLGLYRDVTPPKIIVLGPTLPSGTLTTKDLVVNQTYNVALIYNCWSTSYSTWRKPPNPPRCPILVSPG